MTGRVIPYAYGSPENKKRALKEFLFKKVDLRAWGILAPSSQTPETLLKTNMDLFLCLIVNVRKGLPSDLSQKESDRLPYRNYHVSNAVKRLISLYRYIRNDENKTLSSCHANRIDGFLSSMNDILIYYQTVINLNSPNTLTNGLTGAFTGSGSCCVALRAYRALLDESRGALKEMDCLVHPEKIYVAANEESLPSFYYKP